ncbi:integrase catalytic domain-containing protein [Trichonephila clavipes]|nr:integrase catalytic domain-containing protein [Trichonephila clavipes]
MAQKRKLYIYVDGCDTEILSSFESDEDFVHRGRCPVRGLNIHQSRIPVYHPQANPVERKNRDLKPRLAILIQDKHNCWSEKLPFIRFVLNTAKCETTGQTATFLNFGRELRTPSEVVNDIRVVIQNDNFVPEITPYLKKFTQFSTEIREVVEEQQDSRKYYADKKRKTAPTYQPGEYVFVPSHPLSNAAQGRSKSDRVLLANKKLTRDGAVNTTVMKLMFSEKMKLLFPQHYQKEI